METMSWFDATGFANLAKTALKEAQKTIDKALDIKEEDGHSTQSSVTSPGGGEVSVLWEEEKVPRSESEPELSSARKISQSSSMWGSFTGSFFENPVSQNEDTSKNYSPSRPTNLVSSQPKKSALFRPTPAPKSRESPSPEPPEAPESPDSPGPEPPDDPEDSSKDIREEILNYPPVVYRKKEPRNYNNRLSAISSEGDRRSSSSVEVLGSCTPDSDQPPSLSSSSSVVRLRQSGSFESVEVLTSPSSVEVLGSTSSEHEYRYSSDSISPIVEGEGPPELVEDSEASVAEDSYTSASETLTSGTILDLHHSRDLMLSSMDTSFTEPPKDSMGSDCDAAVSSCEEGTLMGSSGEETTLSRVTSTSYLKTLLADAMTEQSPAHRENSPISSESRSDMIKVGSSGHTSGDELETTTSSDIEIISSPTPNGDSSSAASRQSPARLCTRNKINPGDTHTLGKMFAASSKGHKRELSEASSGGSDDGSEADRLLKRISEMTEILEVREAKLIDMSRLNCDLQEANNDLKRQLESKSQKQDVNELSEEFTQRLAALERKFQQSIREKDQLRKQLEQARVAATAAEEEADKDQVIADLRVEGEKLSKQQLALNNIIKKLRATEKDNQKTINSLKEQLEESSGELERTKKAVMAKQDVERSQIEAVHQLTRTNQRLEAQVTGLQSQVESLTSTTISLQKEVMDSAERCSQLQQRLSAARSVAEAEVRQQLEAEWGETLMERDQLESTVAQLREQMDTLQEVNDRHVQELRREMDSLVRRLELVGSAAEEVTRSVSAATQPLVRQIDSLTNSHQQAQQTWERQERKLLQQISDLQSHVSVLAESERSAREQLVAGNSRVAALEDRLTTEQNRLHEIERQLKDSVEKIKLLEHEKNRLEEERKEDEARLRAELVESRREVKSLQHQLSMEKAAVEAERRKTASLQDQLKAGRGPSPPTTPRSSPTLSLGHASVADSLCSNVWPAFGDDLFETSSASGRLSSVYDSLRPGNTTSLLEGLQSQLKQRDGEVAQLQWELSRREVERAALSNQLATLTVQSEAQEPQLAELATLRTQYDALLLLYGEKLEESQELRMDLQDVKDMYKAQIDQLLKKEPSS